MLFKKIVSIFLAATMMFSTLALTVNAEDVQNTEIFKVEVEAVSATSTVSSNPVIFNKGEEITVNVVASQNAGFAMLQMVVDYDENYLQVVDGKFSATDIYSDAALAAKDGYFVYSSFTDLNKKTATGLLATITFVAKEDVCFTAEQFAELELIKAYPFNNNNGFCVDGNFKELPFVSEVAPFAVHSVSEGVVTAPKCLEEGYTTYHCDICDEDVVGNITEATGHSPAEEPVVENVVDPTCTVDGSFENVIYCTVCEAELSRTTEVIPMLGHDLVPHDSKAPTCTEIGWDTYNACSRCDYTTYVEKEALGHDLVHHDAKAPTCTEIGWDAYDTCSRCDYTTYVEKAATGHTYGESTVVAPTYGADGYTTHTCTVCGFEEKFDIVPALTYILGDVDGSEEITDADAEYLLMHTFFPEDYPINQTADFDGDGKVTDADAEYLLMYTFFPEDYPLK